MNPGVRIEWFSAGMRAASAEAGRFVPARFFAEERGLLKWGPNYAPRFAVAYDLFGNGRTAIKGNYSKYHRQYDADPAAAYSPIGIISERRNWFDCVLNAAGSACSGAAAATNRNGIVEDHEIGPSPAGGTFGTVRNNTLGDLDRRYNWEFTAGVQHQVTPRLAVGAMLFKRQIYEIPLTDRSFITTADYTAFDVRMPADISRDPDVAAVLDPNEMITVYNLNQAKNSVYGQGLIDQSANENRSLYTGVEASFSARLPGGAMMFGSWTAEKNTSVFCESDDNPNGPPTGDLYQGRNVAQGGRFCDQRNFNMPFTQEFKLAGNYSLPLGVDIGAVLQSFGGLERVITWAAGGEPLPEPTADASADAHPDRTGIALRRALGSARCQLQEEHPVRIEGAHVPARHLQRVQQQLDSHDERRRRNVARAGDSHHAGPVPANWVSVQMVVGQL